MQKTLELQSHSLIQTARDLVYSAKRRPRQGNLLRALSTAYYALFHTLAQCCADLLIGKSKSSRSDRAWQQVYRALEHRIARSACERKNINKFPKGIQDFASAFVVMQDRRHFADYDPMERSCKSEVLNDITSTEKIIANFKVAETKDRRAFAAFVLFKHRKQKPLDD